MSLNIRYPFYPSEKTAIFIDGVYLYSTAKALEFDIDYKRLLAWAGMRGRLVRSHYYTILHEDQEYSPIKPLVDWLNYNGFNVVIKSLKEDSLGRRKFQDMNVELTVDAMSLADRLDHVFLFSGDASLSYLVQALQKKGVRVSVFGTTHVSSVLVSDELRRQADHFIEIEDIVDDIARDDYDDEEDSSAYQRKKKSLPEFIEA